MTKYWFEKPNELKSLKKLAKKFKTAQEFIKATMYFPFKCMPDICFEKNGEHTFTRESATILFNKFNSQKCPIN